MTRRELFELGAAVAVTPRLAPLLPCELCGLLVARCYACPGNGECVTPQCSGCFEAWLDECVRADPTERESPFFVLAT